MNILISGGTGFIGKALCSLLTSKGHTLYVLTRNSRAAEQSNIYYIKWQATDETLPIPYVDAVINLAGEPINSGRWTETRKQQIVSSRVTTTQALLHQLSKQSNLPHVFINASAIGYYGTSLTETFTENNRNAGNDFLATTVEKWEAEAKQAENLGMRTVFTRFGIVLGNGGALPSMTLPYRIFLGGTIGSGKQWVSWIHVEDVARMIVFALENEQIIGPINVTAPKPLTMKEFGNVIGNVMKRPHWIPVPSFALKLILGEMSILVLEGQRVLPEKAMQHGFTFAYPNLEEALSTILK